MLIVVSLRAGFSESPGTRFAQLVSGYALMQGG